MDEEADLPHEMDDAAGGIGALLRASRIRRGEELADISSTLRIRHVYMEAIEEDRFDDLPGLVYAIGFVRGYADYLGLDGEEVVRRFKQQANAVEKPRDLTFPSFIPEHGLPRGALLMVALIVAVLGYGGWYFVSTKDRFATEVVAPVPQRLTPGASATTTPANSDDAPQPPSSPDTPSSTSAEPVTPPVEAARAVATSETATIAVETAVASTASETSGETATEAAPSIAAENSPGADTGSDASVASDAATATAAIDETGVAETSVDTSTAEPVTESAEVSAATTAPSIETVPPAEPETVSAAAAPAAVEAPDPSQIPQDSTGPAPSAAEPTQTAAVPVRAAEDTHETPATQPAAAASTQSRIVVRAKLASWVQVRDEAANQLVLTKLLQAGDSYEVPNQPGLVLMTGNAGALEITVDGGAVPSIGEVGTVRRHVALEPDRLKSGTAVVE